MGERVSKPSDVFARTESRLQQRGFKPLPSPGRQRRWDLRYIELTRFVSQWSKDPSTKTGAVIVRPDMTVASIGFNGFARQMSDADELYADRPKKYSRVIHCEMNALLSAREPVAGYTLYTTGMCCDRCVVHLIQAGIKRFVWPEDTPEMKSRWQDAFDLTLSYLHEADGVEFEEIKIDVESSALERIIEEAQKALNGEPVESLNDLPLGAYGLSHQQMRLGNIIAIARAGGAK